MLEKITKYNISYIGHIEEDIELDYINVWIDSKENTKIEFDLAVEVSVDVEGVSGKHHDRDLYNTNIWVMVYCSGSLINRLNDFRILGIEEFNKSKPKKPLSGDFVPYIKKSEYDQYANEILEKYYFNHHPEARVKPIPVNVDELAINMGLSVCDTSISKNRSIFGQVYFADAEAKIYNTDTLAYEKRQIKKDTILVDSEAAYLRSYGSRNMTIAHECVHSYYHRHAFLFAQMFNENLHFIQCQVNGVMKNGESNTTADWMEIQANGLAPYILMPKESFEAYANSLFEHYNQFSRIGSNSINRIIDELAKTYEV
ncbi:MAG: ImmA/IrrE family metallo-endopeptidase, partial [Acholeplasmatales bacterium]|nr:ImmA/IrrE family metallo-endopeptidase [Acholeplasmatales bacterium]